MNADTLVLDSGAVEGARLEVIEDRDAFDRLLYSVPTARVQNSWGWGEARRCMGWEPLRCVLSLAGRVPCAFTIASKKLPATRRRLALIPGAIPVSDWEDRDWRLAAGVLSKFGKSRDIIAISLAQNDWRTDPAAVRRHAAAAGFTQPSRLIQAASRTSVLDVMRTEEQILATMSSDHRRYIRKAARSGVTARVAVSREDMARFHAIHAAMCDRKGMPPFSPGLFAAMWDELCARERARLFLAYHEERLVGGTLVACEPRGYTLIWSAHVTEGPDVGASRLLEWEIVRDARSRGLDYYDLGGLSPAAREQRDQRDGVAFWKLGFGGGITEYAGSLDLPCLPLLYRPLAALNAGERYRRFKERYHVRWG